MNNHGEPIPSETLADRVPNMFGANVFTLEVMRQRLPHQVFEAMVEAIDTGANLEPPLADVVANAMKDWAVEKGATHFCHWFQPMTGLTAEKHDSFISPTSDGKVMMEFSGDELARGEPDASSFPSGGLRESFEARGYTAWDCTSPVFVKEDGTGATMFIPSAFCSYTGKALDNKTPLLRSIEALNRQALRVLRQLGDETTRRVVATLGAEQEYFLVDAATADKRLDLKMTGRTLFGAETPKGMAMSVHYFGSIQERVASFMAEVNQELWKLGVSANTQHNEISPRQYEIAPVFATANVASDHNHLTMEALEKVADRHGLRCLLHAKPFQGFGGSGKHHNWSLVTDRGDNLLDPGDTPWENEVFLLLLGAVMAAVDRHADLLRASVASSGNDLRMGAMEAPPAIISIFLGDQLTQILECIAGRGDMPDGSACRPIQLGVETLPPLPRDTTDRNRTSPFAFTGNRFEFRTPGSALPTAIPIFVLNTIVADVLEGVADRLEDAEDVDAEAQAVLEEFVGEHDRIIYNGDNYRAEWVEEAAERGLPNLTDAVRAFETIGAEKAVELFERQSVLTRDELLARVQTNYQLYAQDLLIEGRCAVRMARRQILPAVFEYSGRLGRSLALVKESGSCSTSHGGALDEVCDLLEALTDAVDRLETTVEEVAAIEDPAERAAAARDRVKPLLAEIREPADKLEVRVEADLWPMPTYSDLLGAG